MTSKYGDISPRTAGYVVRDLLKRSHPGLLFDKFGKAVTYPDNYGDLTLWVCEDAGRGAECCMCTCSSPHYEWECKRADDSQCRAPCRHIDAAEMDHDVYEDWEDCSVGSLLPPVKGDTIKFRRYGGFSNNLKK